MTFTYTLLHITYEAGYYDGGDNDGDACSLCD